MKARRRESLLTPNEGPLLETSIFPLSFQVVGEPLPFAYDISYRLFEMLSSVVFSQILRWYQGW